MKPLNQLTATEIVRAIGSGNTTAEAVARACLERIQQRDARVQAWQFLDPDLVIAQARALDRRGTVAALQGVPIGFKDIIDTSDMPTEYGSPIYKGHRPVADAACVALSRKAGAGVMGKTVTTEFANRFPGKTRNPFDPERTPGGSSSGSAAAVADFHVPLGFGTQTGGSTIRPAAYCGIVGYKPSFGTINCAGMKHVAESLDTIGVLARTVEDCALLVSAVAATPLPDLKSPANAPRIGFCRTSRWESASADTHTTLESAASVVAKAGTRVRDFELPQTFDRIFEDQELIMNFEAARSLAHERRTQPALLSDTLHTTLDAHWAVPRSRYDDAMRHARECRAAFDGLFSDVDVLLTPSAPGVAPRGLASTGSALFNRMWTVLGVPCVTVPFGHGEAGLPLGVQVVGKYGDDTRVLVAAEWIRKALTQT